MRSSLCVLKSVVHGGFAAQHRRRNPERGVAVGVAAGGVASGRRGEVKHHASAAAAASVTRADVFVLWTALLPLLLLLLPQALRRHRCSALASARALLLLRLLRRGNGLVGIIRTAAATAEFSIPVRKVRNAGAIDVSEVLPKATRGATNALPAQRRAHLLVQKRPA